MSEDLHEAIKERLNGLAYNQRSNVTVEEVSPDGSVASLAFDESVSNQAGVHGGALATLADVAGGAAIRAAIGSNEVGALATTNLSIDYLAPGTTDVRADARVKHLGNTLAHVDVDLVSDGDLVAVAHLQFYVGSG